MMITDMLMESDASGREVIEAARTAEYHPAVALLTAFPVDEADWQEMGAHHMLLKPVHVSILLEQIEGLFVSHSAKLARLAADAPAAPPAKKAAAKKASVKKAPAKKSVVKKATKKAPAKKTVKKAAKKTR